MFLFQDSDYGSAYPNIIYEETENEASSLDKDVSDATLSIKYSLYQYIMLNRDQDRDEGMPLCWLFKTKALI